MKFSIVWPLSFVSLLPHIWSWLKSPMSMKGLGMCCIKSSSSNSIMLLLGSIDSKYMLIVLSRVNDTAIACRFMFEFTWLGSSVLLTIIDVPPDALVVCSFDYI